MVNKCYQKHQERLRKEALEKYHTEEEKDERLKKARERYQNLTEEERKDKPSKNLFDEQKQKLLKYRRNYHLTHNE